MDCFIKSNIGTGVPIKDKAEAYEKIFAVLGDIVDKPNEPVRIPTRQKLHRYKSPDEYETREDFRKWVVSCTETNKIRFELYGVLNNPAHQSLLAAISDKIMRDFGDQNDDSCLSVDIAQREIGDIAAPVNKYDKVQRCDEIKEILGETEAVVACTQVHARMRTILRLPVFSNMAKCFGRYRKNQTIPSIIAALNILVSIILLLTTPKKT